MTDNPFADYTYYCTNTRREAYSRYAYGTEEYLKTLEEAIESLFKYELGYGGKVTEVTPTKITVETQVFAKIDTVTFEATEEEMRPLLAALKLWMEAEEKVTLDDWHKRLVQMFGTRDGKIRPCFAAWGHPFAKTSLIQDHLQERDECGQ